MTLTQPVRVKWAASYLVVTRRPPFAETEPSSYGISYSRCNRKYITDVYIIWVYKLQLPRNIDKSTCTEQNTNCPKNYLRQCNPTRCGFLSSHKIPHNKHLSSSLQWKLLYSARFHAPLLCTSCIGLPISNKHAMPLVLCLTEIVRFLLFTI